MSTRIMLIFGLSLVVAGLGIGVYSLGEPSALGGIKGGRKVNGRKVPADLDTAFNAVLAVLKDNRESVALGDRSRGLINTESVAVDNERLRGIVTKDVLPLIGEQDGRYLLSFNLERVSDESTKVTVTSLIIVNTGMTANFLGGQPVASNGTLETQHLDAISKKISGGP